MNKKTLKSYAKLIVRVGANVQKNQDVIINANVEDSYFVKYLVDNFCWCKNRAFFVFKKYLGRYFIKNIVFCNNGRSFSL